MVLMAALVLIAVVLFAIVVIALVPFTRAVLDSAKFLNGGLVTPPPEDVFREDGMYNAAVAQIGENYRWVYAWAAVWMTLFFGLAAALGGGFIRMCGDALRKGARLDTLFSVAKRRWRDTFSALAVVLLSVFFIIGVGVVLVPDNNIGGSLVVSLAALFSILMLFVPQAVVIGRMNAFSAIRASYGFVNANFWRVIMLSVLLIFTEVLLTSLPSLPADLLTFFLVGPLFLLALTDMWLKGTRRKRT